MGLQEKEEMITDRQTHAQRKAGLDGLGLSDGETAPGKLSVLNI